MKNKSRNELVKIEKWKTKSKNQSGTHKFADFERIFADVCLTLSSHGPNREKPCQFPFKYKGKEYSTCTKKDWSSFWCATELKLDGSYRKFGYCNENCPKECGK